MHITTLHFPAILAIENFQKYETNETYVGYCIQFAKSLPSIHLKIYIYLSYNNIYKKNIYK